MKQWLKRTLVLLCTVALVACAGIALTGCKKKKKTHTHEWDSGTVTVEATCSEDGEKLFKCTGCDETKTETIKAAHTWEDEVTVPTCTERGYTTRVCEKCGEKRKDTYVDAKGHAYAKTPHDATCEMDGYAEYECADCGDYYTETTAKATGHNTLNATWTASGEDEQISGCRYERTEVATCATCNKPVQKTYEIEKHSYSVAITTPSTCSTAGVKTYTCKCGDSYTMDYAIVETAHDWGEGTTTEGVTTYTCSHNSAHTKTEIDLTAITTDDEPTVTVSSADIPSGTELKMNNATMKLDDTVKGKLTGDVALTAGKYDQDDETVSAAVDKLSEADKERLGDASIFNFGLQSNGQDVDFGGGKITVSVPYALQEGEDPESIVIAWIKDDGTIELIPATYANGFATFEAEHFSLYTVVRLTAAERCAKYGCKEVAKTIAATCEEDGYTLTTCKICHKTTRSNFTQATGHDYEEQVIAPTCKGQGYTVRTCKNCSDSYTTNYVAKTAHEYESTVVAPTCRAEGYTKFVCKSCRATEYDSYTDKIAHTYQEGACTMCGAKDPSAIEAEDVNFYLNMVQSVLDADMSLFMEVKDINVDITIPDVLLDRWAQREYKSQTYNIKLNSVKMFYALDENGNITAKGEMAMTVKGEFEGEKSEDDYLTEMEGVVKFVMKDGGLYAYMNSSQIEDGETESYESYAYQPIDMGEMPSLNEIKTMLAPVSEKAKIIIDKVYGIKNNPLDSVLAKMTEYVFDKKATEDGYTFTLNYARFAEVYEALTTKTIAELYDSICGKNAFDNTVTYLKGATNKTVKGVLNDFAKASIKAGVSIDDLYAMVNAGLALIAKEDQEPMTVQQFLTAYGDLTIKSILDGMIPSEEPMDYAAMIDQVGATLKQMTLVDIVGMIGGGSEGGDSYLSETDQETAQKPSDPIKTLLDDVAKMLKTTTMGFTTDKLGNVLSLDLNLDVKNFVYDVATLVGFDEDSITADWIDTTELKINATGTAKVTFGGTMDTDYDEIIDKLDSTKKNLTSIDGNIGKDEYGDEYVVKTVGEKVYFVPVLNEESVKAELREYFKNKDQNRSRLSFIEEETVDGKQTSKFLYEVYDGVFRLDKSKDFAFECESDCKGWERYRLSDLDYTYGATYYVWYDESTQTIVKCEWAIDETEKSFSEDNKSFFGLYYNLNTKKVQLTSPHKWVVKEYVEATCEKEGYTKYRCSVCGEVKVYYNYVSHSTYNVYTLKEGSTTCEDGVLEKEHCVLCDKDVGTYETKSHGMNGKSETIGTSKCGEVKFYWRECACGKEKYEGASFLEKVTNSDGETYYEWKSYDVIDGVCDFARYGTIDSESEEQNGKESYRKELYFCIVSNCRFSYTLESWREDNGDCTARSVGKFTAGVDEQGNALSDAKTMTFESTVSNHRWMWRYVKDETKDVGFSEYYCSKCNMLDNNNKYGEKLDEYGRTIRYWHYNIGGGYIREFEGCNYQEYEMNADGSKGEWRGSGTVHAWDWLSPSNSCSQYGVSGKICRLCGKQELNLVTAPSGHNFAPCGDGLYRCTRCDTYSPNGVNGNFYFEDMSDGDNYKLGFFNSLDVDFEVTIELNYTVTDDGVSSVVLDGVEYDTLYYKGKGWQSVVCGTLAIDMTSYNEKLVAYKQGDPEFVFESVSIVFTYLDEDSGTYLSEAYTFGLYESDSQSNGDCVA